MKEGEREGGTGAGVNSIEGVCIPPPPKMSKAGGMESEQRYLIPTGLRAKKKIHYRLRCEEIRGVIRRVVGVGSTYTTFISTPAG